MQTKYTYLSKIKKNICIDPVILVLTFVTTMLGLAILYSASGNSYAVPLKQLARLILGFVFMFGVARIKPHKLANASPYLYLLGLILLVFVFFSGHIGKGAQRWINLGIINFEPSEVMKIALPLFIAKIFHETRLPLDSKFIMLALGIILVPVAITLKQPDLGTAILLVISGCCVIFLAGLSWRIIAYGFVSITISLPIAWHFLHTYQKQRILTFLDPESVPLTTGYHIIQSKIAIGSGGIWGKGYMSGTQSHLKYLPENATDFIFAHICEEFGLFGAMCIFMLLLGITIRGYQIALNAQDTFSRLVAASFSTNFFCYAFINIGMTTGILPVVGVPLPLISYGGSFLVTTMLGLGILMSIHSHKKLITS
ncbi:MAG: rod shape-determining protein RodA [Legionellales bacterium]|jgi:rod shape determining protein RodA|nr:rod shape-determining protein RodA [Legionellales bacterium]